MTGCAEITSGGITCLERPGPGRVFVFLHGIGSNASSFVSVFDHMPEDARLIAWNAPGYGGSRPLAATWPEASDYADALTALLDRLGLERVVLIGHSLGTLIAGAFAMRHGDRIEQMILASCATGYKVPKRGKLPGNVGARIEELELLGADAFAAERAPRLVFEPRLNPDIVNAVRNAMSAVDRGGYAQAVRMLASGDLPEMMSRVRVPTDFIIGINDRVTPEQQTLDTAVAWGRANGQSPRIVRIDQAGHAVYLQKPKDFANAVIAFSTADGAAGADAIEGGLT